MIRPILPVLLKLKVDSAVNFLQKITQCDLSIKLTHNAPQNDTMHTKCVPNKFLSDFPWKSAWLYCSPSYIWLFYDWFRVRIQKLTKSAPKIEKFPKVEGVWGDLKSKCWQKTSFLKRSRQELIFAKNPKSFYQELLKLEIENQKVLDYAMDLGIQWISCLSLILRLIYNVLIFK